MCSAGSAPLGPGCSVPLCWGLGTQTGLCQPRSWTRPLGSVGPERLRLGESRTTAWTDERGVGLLGLPPKKSSVFWEGFLEETMGGALQGGALWGLCPDHHPRGAPDILLACQSAPGQAGLGPSSHPIFKLGFLTGCCLLQDWPFDDGAPPPGKVVEDWLSLLKNQFCDDPGSCVAVHCVAGLGR